MKIKFRAWDRFLGCYVEDRNIFINQDGGIYDIEEAEWYENRYEIEMYIGYEDNSQNEIYVGDICEWQFDNAESDVFEVVWFDKECGYAFRNINSNDYVNAVDLVDEHIDNLIVKIVGNKHKNQELLK